MKNNVFISESKIGKGVFANKSFNPGEQIFKLKGKKFRWEDPIHYTDFGANLIQTGYKTYIMPDAPGVYLNHSCNPNAGIYKNRKLVALEKIKIGEEITFDYSTTMQENFWTLDCMCNEIKCRKKIQDFRQLPKEVQSKYLLLNIVQGFIAAGYKKVNLLHGKFERNS